MAVQPRAVGRSADAVLAQPDFAVTVRRAGRVVIVVVEGECDLSRADELRDTLDAVLEAGVGGLVVDLSGVQFFDSAALGAMTVAWKKAQQLGTPLCTVVTDPVVRRPFEIVGLDRVLMVVGSLGEAFAALRRSAR
jgi:anti-sigma B factor antagonist